MEKKLIDKLTPEQEKMIPVYIEEYLKIGLSTEPCDRAKAEKALKESYKYMKLAEPEIFWADSPAAGAKLAAQMVKGDLNVTPEEIAAQTDKASYGSFEAYWVAFYAFIAEQLGVEHDGFINTVKEIVKHCGVYWTFEDAIVVTEKPVEIHMKDEKLHNPNGLALKYKDGTGVFAINGQRYKSLMDLTLQNNLKEEHEAV